MPIFVGIVSEQAVEQANAWFQASLKPPRPSTPSLEAEDDVVMTEAEVEQPTVTVTVTGLPKITEDFSEKQLTLLREAVEYLFELYTTNREEFDEIQWVDGLELCGAVLEIYQWGSALWKKEEGGQTTIPWAMVGALFSESVKRGERVGVEMLDTMIAEPVNQKWSELKNFQPHNFSLFAPRVLKEGDRNTEVWSDGNVRKKGTGAVLGFLQKNGYQTLGKSPFSEVSAKNPLVHTVVVYASTGNVYPCSKNDTVDHLGSRSNNRMDCLRPATKSMQAHNHQRVKQYCAYTDESMTEEEKLTMETLLKPIDILDDMHEVIDTVTTVRWGWEMRIHLLTGRIFLLTPTGWKYVSGSKNNRYKSITLHGKPYQYHRIVAMNVPFLREQLKKFKPGLKLEVNHKDCDPMNNSPLNLEWLTPDENKTHAHGKKTAVEVHGEIFEADSVAAVCREIEKKFGYKSKRVDSWISGRYRPPLNIGFKLIRCEESNKPHSEGRTKKGVLSNQKEFIIEYFSKNKRKKESRNGRSGVVAFLKTLGITITENGVNNWIRQGIPKKHKDTLISISAAAT